MNTGIISNGASEWVSPTVLVRKMDGTVRYCIDLRKVKEDTVKDRYPFPKISECIDALAGCEYFSCFATVKVWQDTWEMRKPNLEFWNGPYGIIQGIVVSNI